MMSFDLETTGLNADSCSIVSAAIVQQNPNASMHIIAYTPHMTAESTAIHGLTAADTINGFSERDVILFIKKFWDNNQVIKGWNIIKFDVKFLAKRAKLYNIDIDLNKIYIDTKLFYNQYYQSMTLGDAYEALTMQKAENAHDAMFDVKMESTIFDILMQQGKQPKACFGEYSM